MSEVFLVCKECIRLEKYEKGVSDSGFLPPQARIGQVIKVGSLFSWMIHHHEEFSGKHNRFTVFNTEGEVIGEAGFGRQAGFIFRKRALPDFNDLVSPE